MNFFLTLYGFNFSYNCWLNAQPSIYVHQQNPEFHGIEVEKKVRIDKMKALLIKACPDRSFLWDYLMGRMEASELCLKEN